MVKIFLVSEPYQIHLVVRIRFQQQFGTLQSISLVRFSQLLRASPLQTLQTKSLWTMRNTDDCRMPVSLKISRTERWVFGWFSWLIANSSTVETFYAVRAVLGWPLPFFCSTVPISPSFFRSLLKLLFFPVFLRKLAHQFPSSIAFNKIQIFNEHFIFVTESHFGSYRNTYLHKIVCYLQRIFNGNRKLKQ